MMINNNFAPFELYCYFTTINGKIINFSKKESTKTHAQNLPAFFIIFLRMEIEKGIVMMMIKIGKNVNQIGVFWLHFNCGK